MKQLDRKIKSYKKGAASLYIVIFTTLLLGLIVLSFTRVMVSDARQTSNQDLSQSAYDSALAGIEDAKIALLKYHDCISQGYTAANTGVSCGDIISRMQSGIASGSCDVIMNTLGRQPDKDESGNDKGVIISEVQDANDNSAYLEQAYTCVTVQEKLSDYRSYLNNENRVRVVPLRTAGTNGIGGGINDVKYIKFSWYSAENYQYQGSATNFVDSRGYFAMPNKITNLLKPPIVSVQLIQTDERFRLSELSVSNGSSGTDRATILFYPVDGSHNSEASENGGTVKASRLIEANSKAYYNKPFMIKCDTTAVSAFLCNAYIEVPSTFNGSRNEGTSYLVVNLPYGEPSTDFSVMLCNAKTNDCNDTNGDGTTTNDTIIQFTGVQTKVDSTGRANDLFRRVETRIELVDTYFPYPEFAIQMTGSGEESKIQKSFWVSNNCWISKNGGFHEQGGNPIAGCVDSSNI